MAKIKDGGSAFPVPLTHIPSSGELVTSGHYFDGDGMSLRDYFAAKALPQVIKMDCDKARFQLKQDYDNCNSKDSDITPDLHDDAEAWDVVASCAYAIADAMLAEREKGRA